MKFTAIRSLCLFGVLSASTSAYAASTSFSTVVPQVSGFSGTAQPITGLSQFDPSQGTLTGITISGQGNFTATGSLLAFVEDFEQSHSVDVMGNYQISIGINLPGGGGLLAANQGSSFNFACMGQAFEDACTDNLDPIEDSGFYNSSEQILQRVTNAGILDEFIGTGNVSEDLLELGLFTFFNGSITDQSGEPFFDFVTGDFNPDFMGLENIGIEFLDINFELGPSNVTIQYDYDPVTVIPVPAAVWLFGSALIGFAGLARRKQV